MQIVTARLEQIEKDLKGKVHDTLDNSSTQAGGLGITAGNFSQNPTLSVTKALHFHHETKLRSRLSSAHEDIWRKYSTCIRNI